MSTVSVMYDNSTTRLVELLAEVGHYADLTISKTNYINSTVTSMVNLMDQWVERDPQLAARWASDRVFINDQIQDTQRKLDKITVTNVDTMITLKANKEEASSD